MKKIITLIILTLALIKTTYAFDLVHPDDLKKQGMVVKLGELTGAGSTTSVKHLTGLILPEGVLMIDDCSEVVLKTNNDPKISDIIKITFQNHEILSEEFIGFVTK